MDSMSEGDVAGELVEFAADGDLSSIGTGIRHQCKTIAGRHHRIRNHEVLVEEELQQGDGSAGNRAVSGWIARVSRRALGERLREQVCSVLAVALCYGLGVQRIAVNLRLYLARIGDVLMQHAATRFRPMYGVDEPLLEPRLCQGPGST